MHTAAPNTSGNWVMHPRALNAPIDAPALPDPIVAPQQTALEGAESGEPYADASGGGSVGGW